MSFEQLSEMTSFTPEELQGFESGLLIPDDDCISELAEALGRTEEDLDKNDFVKKNLKEVELLKWIEKRNKHNEVWDNLKFLYAFTDRFDEKMPEEELHEYSKTLDQMKIKLKEQKEELMEIMKTMPLLDVLDVYEFYLDKKILDLSKKVTSSNPL